LSRGIVQNELAHQGGNVAKHHPTHWRTRTKLKTRWPLDWLLPSAATFEFLFATIKDDDEFADNWPNSSLGIDRAIGNFCSSTLEKIF
jgi:hypothetical protein